MSIRIRIEAHVTCDKNGHSGGKTYRVSIEPGVDIDLALRTLGWTKSRVTGEDTCPDCTRHWAGLS
jgi:hypothetical protein